MSGRGTNVGALVTHRTVVRQAALGETSDTIPERTPRVGSRALHNEPAAIDVRPLPTNAWSVVCRRGNLRSHLLDRPKSHADVKPVQVAAATGWTDQGTLHRLLEAS